MNVVPSTGIPVEKCSATTMSSGVIQNLDYEIIGLTPQEVWELLTNTSNGIQTPTDIRTDEGWDAGFIDTPYPESPIHYPLERIQDPDGLEEFIELCYSEEVILYGSGKGGRIYIVFKILTAEGFNGTIYYIDGGIITWQEAGFPIRNNTEPDAPTITGKTPGKVGVEYEYTFNAEDPDEDGVRYFIDWDDNNTEWTEFNYSGTNVTVKHSWDKLGTYNITAKTFDFYDYESSWGYLLVRMPKNKASDPQFNLIEWFLERFPHAFQILRHLLG